MKFMRMEFVLILLLALSITLTPSAGFKISGAIFQDAVSPGQVAGHEIVLSLEKDAMPLNITAETFGYAMNENGTNIQIAPEEDTGPYSAREYLTVMPEELALQPGESKKLMVEADIPVDVGSGGRYALIVLKTLNPMEGNKNIRILTAVQIPVLLEISGSEIVQSGEITDLSASKKDDGAVANIRFKNTGNYHYKPVVDSVLKTKEGEVLLSASQQSSSAVLPDGSWFFSVPMILEPKLSPGTYAIEAKVTGENGMILDEDKVTFEA